MRELTEGDVVLPVVPLLGTWTEAAVVKAKHVVKVGRMAATSAPADVPLQGEQGRMAATASSCKQ